MNLSPYEREVLDLVVEDDYGLWEIRWRLDTVFGPDPDAQRAQIVLQSMLTKGLVTVQWEPREDPADSVSLEDGPIDLADRNSWDEPSGDDRILTVTATDRGHCVYLSSTPTSDGL